MGYAPNYYESHLVVAAIRVLGHRNGRPPTPEEVAELLGYGTEKTYVLMHELKGRKIIRVMESPFDVRMEVIDPVPLETLPREASDPAMKEEIADFHSKSEKKQKDMERMFRGGEAEKRRRERVAKLEAQFKSFKPKPGGLDNLFGGAGQGDPGSSDSEDEPADDPEPRSES
jgi:hypothetical protein